MDNPPNALICDFDGVLVDSVDIKTEAFSQLYSEYGSDIEDKVVAHHVSNLGVSRFEKIKYYHSEYLSIELTKHDISKICERFSSIVVDKIVAAPEIEGASILLEQYSDSMMIFVNSGTPHSELNTIIQRRGWSNYFEEVYGSPKSKTANLLSVLETYCLRNTECWFLGDAPVDYQAACAVGVPFLGICKSENRDLFPTDEANFQCYENITQVLEKLNTLNRI